MTDNLIQILDHIDPSMLTYQEWINVGMGLKEGGYSAGDWDAWSSRDFRRYHHGECEKKWSTFKGTTTPITEATIVKMAMDHGYKPYNQLDEGHALDWGDVINNDNVAFVDKNWLEDAEIAEPETWRPEQDLIRYLETLFDSTENVGYVCKSWERDGRHMPSKGMWNRTAGQLIHELNQCNGDIGAVLGDYKPEVGAWIRFNPLDGNGIKNENVSDFRYALVESDTMSIEKQNAIIRELELPVACLVHSGKKSLHAIVKVNAKDYGEYRKRVDYLYSVCEKNGLELDNQNRNPSRLSRMPGVMRNGQKQFLVDTNIGKRDWAEWEEWIDGINDDLPDPEGLVEVWHDLPDLSQPLIDGVLRQGHKMLLAGPSKAGKSFALIQLCIAVAEGTPWMGWPCEQGRVLYVNLELDRASCLHRFKDVYTMMGVQHPNIHNIDIWNLRGKSVPMDKLAPKLVRRAQKKDYIAVVIDPIYKVITGDENAADQMAHFTNQFDKVCTELGSAVIYCHHHSKGYQGGKRSMDRASGSGVFARDPDALIDLVELDIPENTKTLELDKACAATIDTYIKTHNPKYHWQEITAIDSYDYGSMKAHAQRALSGEQSAELDTLIKEEEVRIELMTAWRLEGVLREFQSFKPRDLWFKYPLHMVDAKGVLEKLQPEAEKAPWQKAMESRKTPEEKKEERKSALEVAFEACNMDGDGATVRELMEYMGLSKSTVWRRIKDHGGFESVSVPGEESKIVPVPRT